MGRPPCMTWHDALQQTHSFATRKAAVQVPKPSCVQPQNTQGSVVLNTSFADRDVFCEELTV